MSMASCVNVDIQELSSHMVFIGIPHDVCVLSVHMTRSKSLVGIDGVVSEIQKGKKGHDMYILHYKKKRALLRVKKLRSSLLANSKLRRTLYGFTVFQVEWKDVRGISYINKLQTDTSLAIETKTMKRWEFDSISQAVKYINPWFPGTPHERSILEKHLNSMVMIISETLLEFASSGYSTKLLTILGKHTFTMQEEIPHFEEHFDDKVYLYMPLLNYFRLGCSN